MSVMQCSSCGESKDEDQFSWKNKASGRRSRSCKACHKVYCAKHYRDNPGPYIDRAKAARPALREAARNHIIAYLLDHPCVDCGECDIEVLEFDHVERVGPSARRVWGYNTIASIDREIAKCEVRCANCHTRRTRKQMGWRPRVFTTE